MFFFYREDVLIREEVTVFHDRKGSKVKLRGERQAGWGEGWVRTTKGVAVGMVASWRVEVSEESSSAFEGILNTSKCSYKLIGKTNKSSKIVVKNFIDLDVAQTKKTWENALREKLQ